MTTFSDQTTTAKPNATALATAIFYPATACDRYCDRLCDRYATACDRAVYLPPHTPHAVATRATGLGRPCSAARVRKGQRWKWNRPHSTGKRNNRRLPSSIALRSSLRSAPLAAVDAGQWDQTWDHRTRSTSQAIAMQSKYAGSTPVCTIGHTAAEGVFAGISNHIFHTVEAVERAAKRNYQVIIGIIGRIPLRPSVVIDSKARQPAAKRGIEAKSIWLLPAKRPGWGRGIAGNSIPAHKSTSPSIFAPLLKTLLPLRHMAHEKTGASNRPGYVLVWMACCRASRTRPCVFPGPGLCGHAAARNISPASPVLRWRLP